MAERFAVLTVCQGNVHRSALAASLLRVWVGWYLPVAFAQEVTVSSAGLGAPVGAPMDDRVIAMVQALGAEGDAHRATQLTDDMLASADLILVASRRQLDEVLQRCPSALRRTFTVREAGRIAERMAAPATPTSPRELRKVVESLAGSRPTPDPDADDIVDPHGRGDEAYLQMAREEVGALARVAAILFGMPRPDLDAYLAAAEDPAALLASGAARGREA